MPLVRVDRSGLASETNRQQSTYRGKVVRGPYAPWLDKSARHFQELIAKIGTGTSKLGRVLKAKEDVCILFTDGLRYDVAGILQVKLEERGM